MKKKFLWRHPRGYVYVRIRGRLHRITAPEGSAEFDALYWEILRGQNSGSGAPKSTSWAALVASYRSSERWACLRARTQSDYENILSYIEQKLGPRDVRQLRRPDITALMEENRHRTRFANYIAQVVSILCEHAIDLGWRRDNPAKGVRRLKTPQSRREPHVPWPDWAVERMRAEAGALPRLIFEIGIGTVQRPGDWVTLRWSDFDGEALWIKQGKTERELHLPCSAQLKAALEAAPRSGLTILAGRGGRPLSYRRLAEIMRKERERLGLSEFDLHALRYRGVMELAWSGCDDDEIASYSGHASKAMICKYAGMARQIMRARQAHAKRRSPEQVRNEGLVTEVITP